MMAPGREVQAQRPGADEANAMFGAVTLLTAVSGAGSLMRARMAEERGSLHASAEVAGRWLSGDEARESLAGRG